MIYESFDDRIKRFELWTKTGEWRTGWPRAIGYVFLGEAVLRFGRYHFGSEWSDLDPIIGQVPPKTTEDALWVKWQNINLRKLNLLADYPSTSDRDRSLVHFEQIQRTISDLAVIRVLNTGVQAPGGGAVTALPWEAWQTQNLGPRFSLCQFDPEARLSSMNTTSRYHGYIFVSAESLDRCIADEKLNTASSNPLRTTVRKGRRPGSGAYDWLKFEREVFRQLGEEGMIDSDDPAWRQSTLEGRMSEWVIIQDWKPGPSESTIRRYVVEAIKKHKQRKAE
jgi:hypothetical protein